MRRATHSLVLPDQVVVHVAPVQGQLVTVDVHRMGDQALEQIPPHKDVDGLHPYNAGRLAQGNPTFIPATPSSHPLMTCP